MTIRAIAFDFDGVLVESTEVKAKAFARIFSGEDDETLERIISYHVRNGGISRFEKFRAIYRDILQRPLTNERFQSLCDQYAELVVEDVVKAPWVEGAQEFLRHHRERFLFFIISGTPEGELQEIVRRRGASRFFDEVMGSPSPKHRLLQDALDRHAIRTSDVIFVGDAESDWIAARDVGVRFIWRQASSGSSRPAGFSGPAISSLAHLDACLADVM